MATQNHATSGTPPLPPSASASAAAYFAARRSACAACKYNNKRCTAQCPLAPYFPADKQNDFDNMKRLFGIGRVAKLLRQMPPHHRDAAAQSIIYEANYRAEIDPVGGCCAAVKKLHRLIELREAELKLVEKNLALCRARLMLPGFNANSFFNINQETNSGIQEIVRQLFLRLE